MKALTTGLLLSLGLFSQTVWSAGSLQKALQLGLAQEENNGGNKSIQRLAGHLSYDQIVDFTSLLTYSGEMRLETSNKLADKTLLYGDVTYSLVPKPGFGSWMYLLTVALEKESYSDATADVDSLYLTGAMRKRLDDRTQIQFGLKWQQLSSSFDLDGSQFFASADWIVNPQWTLYSTLTLGTESITSPSTASANRAARALAGGHLPHEVSNHNQSSNATVSAATGSNSQDIDTNKIALGAVFLLDENSSFDITLDLFDYQNSSGSDIDGQRLGVDYFYRF